ncbi:MAG TPA: hypothetical protein VH040_08775 [Usitatibacter sp.]|nr:hypothetical protein [Usitatibacter sp.]
MAVRLDPDGLGQALIYPYYTVRASNGNAWNTALSVVNTRANAKVVKVRFREGKHARVVWEANVYLGPNDVWTAGVVLGSDGAPHLASADRSCIDPPLSASDGGAFSTAAFSGAAGDGAGSGTDRLLEGFAEVIEMGTLTGATAAAVTMQPGPPSTFNCALVTGIGKTRGIANPEGGLSGSAFLINVNSGLSVPYHPIALADLTAEPFYSDVGAPGTDYDSPQVTPLSIVTIPPSSANGFGSSPSGYLLRSNWNRGVDAVSAVLMTATIHNEFVLDSMTASNTDWIVTLPTARFYVDGAATSGPFDKVFGPSGACEEIDGSTFNREQAIEDTGDVGFPEPPPLPPPPALCWAANAVSYRNGSIHAYTTPTVPSLVLASSNTVALDIVSTFQDGFVLTSLAPAGPGLASLSSSTAIDLATGNTIVGAHTFGGLPVVGSAAWKFDNGLLNCAGQACKGSFGASYSNHFIKSVIRAAP